MRRWDSIQIAEMVERRAAWSREVQVARATGDDCWSMGQAMVERRAAWSREVQVAGVGPRHR